VWSECINGSKERLDKLKEKVSSADCKSEKHITKHCKKRTHTLYPHCPLLTLLPLAECTYEKSEWSACENGNKTKTLALVEGTNVTNSPDCEKAKTITKVCTKGPKAKRIRNKKTREQVDG